MLRNRPRTFSSNARIQGRRLPSLVLGISLGFGFWGSELLAAPAQPEPSSESLASALSPQQWNQVEQSIDRALAWLAKQQDSDGSIDAPTSAQPAATSLAVMAFLSKGHIPGEGPYGRVLDKAIDFVLRCQHSDGLLAYSGGGGRSTSGKTANYNHAIAGLMLTEVYGMTDRKIGRA